MTYRITDQKLSEEIALGVAMIPNRLWLPISHVHFFTEDPIWTGVSIHPGELTKDGRSYREVSHVLYPHHSYDKHPTIVLRRGSNRLDVVHEIGHIIDWYLGFRYSLEPITEYAETDSYESFAEAFVGYLFWYGKQPLNEYTERLFDMLGTEDEGSRLPN